MAKKQSAGLLLYRTRDHALEVFLVHPGGPFWAKKDLGAWSIPKGEFDETEDALAAARRETREETGLDIAGDFRALAPVKQKSGKSVHGFAVEADCDAAQIRSNTFAMEWPPKSGRMQDFPEVDRAEWFAIETARAKIHPGQAPLLDQLQALLDAKA